MMSKAKVAAAGLRVLELYKYMANEPCSQKEIIKLIEENEEVSNVYAKETISKYFNTLRVVGFDVEKISGRFYLKNDIDNLHLNINEIHALNFLKRYMKSMAKSDIQTSLMEQFRKIENSLDPESYEMLKSQEEKGIRLKNLCSEDSKKLLKQYEHFCSDKQQLLIRYQGKLYKIHPKELIIKSNNTCLIAYYPKEGNFKEFLIESIDEVTQLPSRFPEKNIVQDVTFVLKGHLAKVYVSRDEERIDVHIPSTLTVTNRGKDREILMRRLLRYRENCEVKFPNEFRDDFKNLLDSIIEQYE